MGCNTDEPFSFCQEYYLFQYDATNHRCQRFKRQPCTSSCILLFKDRPDYVFSDVTLTTQLS